MAVSSAQRKAVTSLLVVSWPPVILQRRVDPATGEVLTAWDQALDELGDQPHHVARFGERFDAQGVLAGSKDAARCIGYLTKYLTKQVGNCHHAETDPAGARGPAG
jgi:hypothetical protein